MARAATSPKFDSFVAAGGGFMWLTTSGKACDGPMGGCDARNELVLTLGEWVERGLPRTGATFCGGWCYCILVPMLDLGIGVPEDLGGDGFSLDEIENNERAPDQGFSDVERLDPGEFIDELRAAPVTGTRRMELDALIDGFEKGSVDFDTAKAEADRILGLG